MKPLEMFLEDFLILILNDKQAKSLKSYPENFLKEIMHKQAFFTLNHFASKATEEISGNNLFEFCQWKL